jgi:hypothetical protein
LEALMVAKTFWLVGSVGTFCAALGAGALAASWQSYSEDSEVNDGKWIARIDGDAKTARQGRVVIENFAGEWREIGPRRAGDPCRGARPFPITVQRSNDNQVEFTAWAESVSKCPDFALTLKKVDESTLVGTTTDGREVRLTREPAKRKAQR